MRGIPNGLKGGAMLAGTALVWGGMFAVVKPLTGTLDPFTLTLLRYGPTAPIFLLLLLAVEGRGAFRLEGKGLRLWWLGTLGFAGFGILAFLGLRLAQPEHAAVMPATMPLIAVVIGAWRARRWPAGRALAAVALGLAGVVLVVTRGAPAALLAEGAGAGEALVFLGAVGWVLYTLGAASFPGWSGLRYTALSSALGLLSILVLEGAALAIGQAHLPSPASLVQAAPSLAYLVLLTSVLGVLGWNAGMRALGPARGVLFINLVPVTAFGIAVAAGRVPAAAEWAGVALVIAALVLNSLPARAAPAPARAVVAQ
jgi:drug/metabolite transporter (DMT)-like permease